jgi:hypothetical protein
MLYNALPEVSASTLSPKDANKVVTPGNGYRDVSELKNNDCMFSEARILENAVKLV